MTETLLFRAAVTEANGIDLAAGTAKLSFSSEHPVLRRGDKKHGSHIEILSHAPGDLNNSVLERGAPVMLNHDASQIIGSVARGSFQVGSDRRGRATIKVDPSWRTYLAAIASGEAPNAVSVGYSTLSVVKREEGQDGIPVLTFAWLPEEISILTKGNPPADPRVGFGRSSSKSNNMKNSLDEILALALSGSRKTDDDFSDVSLLQTINEAGSEATGRVREMQNATRIPDSITGTKIHFSAFEQRMTRDSTAGSFASAGAFIQNDMFPGTPLLFNTSVGRQLGWTFVTSLHGNITNPRGTTAPVVQALGEVAPVTASDILTAADAVKPVRLAAQVVLSNQWLRQTGPAAEAYVRNMIAEAVSTELDKLALFGSGGNDEPLGITQQVGCQSIVFNGVTWDKLLKCEKSMADANIPIGRAGWAISPSTQAFMKGAPKIAGYPSYLLENGQINGAPALASNQLAGSDVAIYSSAWETCLICVWGSGMWFVSDPYSLAPRAKTILTVCMLFQVLPLYPQAFLASADAANQ